MRCAPPRRNVGHPVMDHPVDDVRGLVVRRGPDRLDAAALVNAHVDDDGAVLHVAHQRLAHQDRRPAAGNQDRPDHQVGMLGVPGHGVRVAVDRGDVGRHDLIEVSQAVQVDVHDDDVGPESCGHPRGVGPDDAATEDEDVGRFDACHAAQEDAAAHHRLFQVLGPFLDGHLAGDFAHGRQERQPPAGVAERLIGHGRDAGGKTPLGQRPRCGKMEIAEDHLAARRCRISCGWGSLTFRRSSARA